MSTSSRTPKPRDNYQQWDGPLSSRLRTTCLVPSRVFLDSSTTAREAAGACPGGGVTTEPRGTRGSDLSSSLPNQTSLFRVQTVRLLLDPRIRPLPALPALREEPPSSMPQWFSPERPGTPSPSPQETDNHSFQRLGSPSAHLPRDLVRDTIFWKNGEREFVFIPSAFLVLF